MSNKRPNIVRGKHQYSSSTASQVTVTKETW